MAQRSVVEGLPGHVAGLRRFALALTGSRADAEDLVQETLVRAIAAVDSWRGEGALRAWLFSIMYNAFRTGERRRGWLPSAADDDWPELSQPAPQLVRLELQDVLSALARLPDPQRAAISLIALEDFSYQEAARILDVPVGTLTSRLARGREALRQIMAGEAEARPALRVIEGKR